MSSTTPKNKSVGQLDKVSNLSLSAQDHQLTPNASVIGFYFSHVLLKENNHTEEICSGTSTVKATVAHPIGAKFREPLA